MGIEYILFIYMLIGFFTAILVFCVYLSEGKNITFINLVKVCIRWPLLVAVVIVLASKLAFICIKERGQ